MPEVKMTIVEPKTIKEQIDAAKERIATITQSSIESAKEQIAKMAPLEQTGESSEQSGEAPCDESEEEEQPSEKPMDTTTGESDGDEENSDSDTAPKSETQEEKPVTSDECPACHCRKRKKTGGFPFGRDPAEASAQPKKPKEDRR